MLGTREPEVCGTTTLVQIDERIAALAAELGWPVESFQSNGESELVTRMPQAAGANAGIIINSGAHTHTAVFACGLPTVEVHLTGNRRSWTSR